MKTSPTVTRHTPANKALKPYTRASVPFGAGELVAIKHDGQDAIRVVFIDAFGESSYPMLSKQNKEDWQSLINALA